MSSDFKADILESMPTDESYLKPYREAAIRHGGDFAATLWKSPEAQQKRFQTLIEMLGPERCSGTCVVDVGCGRGDLALELDRLGVHPRRYVGIEGVEEIAKIARERVENLPFATEISLCDVVSEPNRLCEFEPDIIIASGTLNTMPKDVAEGVVRSIIAAARGAVGFNFLTAQTSKARQEEDTSPAHRFDPIPMLQIALDASPLVAFRQDYLLGHDATIVLFFEDHG